MSLGSVCTPSERPPLPTLDKGVRTCRVGSLATSAMATFFVAALCVACSDDASTRESTQQPATQVLPFAALRDRVEDRLFAERDRLRDSIGHYGLVFDIAPSEFARSMARIVARRSGPDLVMGSAHGVELHGGGVLGLLAGHWRPNGASAQLDDSYTFSLASTFASSSPREPIPLQAIYDTHTRQLFLPLGGAEPSARTGEIPTSPRLARMRVRFAPNGLPGTTEVDAYSFLALLLRYERDLDRVWVNDRGQRLSTELVLQNAWERYATPETAAAAFEDHSYLHLPGILLEYAGRDPRRDPNEIKRRFLSAELGRTDYGGYDASEALGHYADSLGFLLADPRIGWASDEKRSVLDWLAGLERRLLSDLGQIPLQHLAHLLRGLRTIERNSSRLQ